MGVTLWMYAGILNFIIYEEKCHPCSATTARASVGLLSVSSAQSLACYCRCWPKLVTGGKPQPHLQLARRRHFQGGSKWR